MNMKKKKYIVTKQMMVDMFGEGGAEEVWEYYKNITIQKDKTNMKPNKIKEEKKWIMERGVFPEFDRNKMTVGGWKWLLMRLQPWKWKYVKRHGMFFRR